MMAASVWANTIESSTLIFEGALTDAGGGIYTGTVDATAGSYYVPGGPGTIPDGGGYVTPDGRPAVGGWDVYAREGATAYYDDVAQGVINGEHDGYPGPAGGGWGDFWSPDVPDWGSYQLTLTTDHWYLEFKGVHLGTPMSGAMDWIKMYASEDDTGSYRGTVPADPDANDGGAATLDDTSPAWDMDWTWGSELIPLQFSGFDVTIDDLGGGNYRVTLAPAPAVRYVPADYPTIQDAIDAANAGDTIVITTDLSEGQVVINKDLTIQGGSVHTITASADTGSSGDSRGWFLVDPDIEVHVSDLIFDGNGYLIYQGFRHKGKGSFTNCTFREIKYNESGPHYAGVAIAVFGGPGNPVDVTGCTFEEIGRVGVLYYGSGCSGSVYSNNTYTGKGDGDWLDYALDISAGAQITVQDSIITNCTGVASSDGSTSAGILGTTFYGGGTTMDVTGCEITGCSTGVFVGYDGTDTTVATINENKIYGNTTAGVQSTAPQVDATNNWWGDTDPTDDIIGNVIAYPVYTDDTMTVLYAPVENLTQGTYYETLQEAIADAVADDTLYVRNGVHVENGQIVIDKNLTILGEDKLAAILKPNQGTGSGYGTTSGWILVPAGVTFNLSNVTLDCSGQAVQMAIQSRGDSIIEDCVIQNVMKGTYDGRGIVFLSGTNNAVRRCDISNTQRIGIHVRGAVEPAAPVAVIEDCTYTGKGDGDWLDYGVEFGGGGAGSVIRCTITDCTGVALSDGSTSAGILITDYYGTGTDATVASCDISNCTAGIYVGYADVDVSTATILYNDLGDNVDYGIYATAAVDVEAAYNWWGDASGPAPIGSGIEASAVVITAPWLEEKPDLIVDQSGLGDYMTIQEAIDNAPGTVILVGEGVYDETLNIDNKTDLHVVGVNKDTTIIQSSSVLSWAIAGYSEYDGRMSVVRVVNSTNCSLENMTLDCDLIKGNNRFGVSGWDSSFTMDNLIVQNMSVDDLSGGYYELGSYFRAPGFTDAARADVTVTNCTFIDAGRVGVVTHDYINGTISNNVFYKTFDDFGYAIEMGSQSVGTISGNQIYGYDIPAASDGSESAGIYIENAFTDSSLPVVKNVLVEDNEVYGCQYGMWIGNGYDGFAGDVDIVVTLSSNSFHDNVEGGAWIQDEDASAGSSVTVTGGGNTWTDNGDYGLRIYTGGDGDVAIALTGDIITGHDTGVSVEDAGAPGTSVYSVSVNEGSISGNTASGVNNTVAGLTVDAINNWWGAADGPSGEGLGSGDAVSINVDFFPYLAANPATNILKLNVAGDPAYLQPGDSVLIDMDALNLAQHVLGCQAILNFSSTYFQSGAGEVDVQPGGGVWDELIWNVWNTAGDLDVAVGVDLNSAIGTMADGTVAKVTLTVDPAAPDGITQMIFRPDVDDIEGTFFADLNALAVYPGAKIDSQDIVIDGTDPVVEVTYPNGGEILAGGDVCTITWTATDVNIDADSILLEYYDGIGWVEIAADEDNDGSYDWTLPLLNIDTAKVRVTASDLAGNSASDESDAAFIIDSTDPSIDIISVSQNGDELLGGGTAVQGDVTITVSASDGLSGLAGAPTVIVTPNGGTPEDVSGTVVDNGDGTFDYTFTVTSTTPNGIASIDVSVEDQSGNLATDSDTFNINKNVVTAAVSQDTLRSNVYSFDRDVKFVATDAGGAALKTWIVTVSFTNDGSTKIATGTAELTDVPAGTVGLSADTDWTLRGKVTGLDMSINDGQAAASFTGADKLRVGDMNNSNTTNILDYAILKQNWFTTNAVADLNGDGVVNILDYSLLKTYWFQAGDPE